MRHLSLTGYDAGIRLCGARDGQAFHAVYVADEAIIARAFKHGEILCDKCCSIMEEVMSEEEKEAAKAALAGREEDSK